MKKTILAIAALFLLTGCNNYSTAPDQQAVHEAGGPLSDQELVDCVPPSKKGRDGVFETFYYYPTSTRNFRALSGDTEADPFTVVSEDNAEMRVPMTITFTLTNDCKQLMEFHRELGNRFAAYMDGKDTSHGWIEMLQFVMGVPADTLLDRIAQQHSWRDLWNDPATKAAVEHQLETQLPGMVAQQSGGRFFNIQNVLVLKPEPVDENLTRAINLEQSAVARANAQEAQAQAEEARAQAQVAVAEAEAAKRRAEISGYGSVDAYLRALAIQRGQNPWQPTYVVPGGIPR